MRIVRVSHSVVPARKRGEALIIRSLPCPHCGVVGERIRQECPCSIRVELSKSGVRIRGSKGSRGRAGSVPPVAGPRAIPREPLPQSLPPYLRVWGSEIQGHSPLFLEMLVRPWISRVPSSRKIAKSTGSGREQKKGGAFSLLSRKDERDKSDALITDPSPLPLSDMPPSPTPASDPLSSVVARFRLLVDSPTRAGEPERNRTCSM